MGKNPFCSVYCLEESWNLINTKGRKLAGKRTGLRPLVNSGEQSVILQVSLVTTLPYPGGLNGSVSSNNIWKKTLCPKKMKAKYLPCLPPAPCPIYQHLSPCASLCKTKPSRILPGPFNNFPSKTFASSFSGQGVLPSSQLIRGQQKMA